MNWYKRQFKIAMPTPIQFSDEELQRIGKMLQEGKSFRNIGRIYNVAQKVIMRLNDKYRWRDLEKERRERDDKILNLYLLPPKGKGLTAKEISRQTGIRLPSIKNTLKRLGLGDQIRSVSDENKRRWQDPEERAKQSIRTRQFFESNPKAGKDHSIRMLEWWKQFESEEGGKFENRLLSYPTRQRAINHLRGFMGREFGTDPQKANAVYGKYIQIINNHTYPDEIQQSQPPATQEPQLV